MGCKLPLLSIQEVEKRTGVKAVTLRAWQRRYGLLEPQRSEKGHRLYSEQDIQCIESILYWLTRGVSIGKVRALLEQNPSNEGGETQTADDIEPILMQLARGEIDKVETKLREIFQLYPFEVAQTQYVEPIHHALRHASQPFTPLCQGMWRAILMKEYLFQVQKAGRGKGKTAMLINLDDAGSLGAWQAAAWLCSQGYAPQCIDGLRQINHDAVEWVNALPKQCVALYGERRLESKTLSSLLRLSNEGKPPLMVLGEVATIHQPQWLAAGATLA